MDDFNYDDMPEQAQSDVLDMEVMPESSSWSNPRQAKRESLPPLNVANSKKILQFYTDNPQWLANPYTTHAANAVFAGASKVIGLNAQLERLNAQTKAAENRNFITLDGQKMLSAIVKINSSAVAAYLLPNAEGVEPTMTGENYQVIGKLYETIVLPTLVNKANRANSIDIAARSEQQHLVAADAADAVGNIAEGDFQRSLAKDQSNYRSKLSIGLGTTTEAKAINDRHNKLKQADFAAYNEIGKAERELAAAMASNITPDVPDKPVKAAQAKLSVAKSQRKAVQDQMQKEFPTQAATAASTTPVSTALPLPANKDAMESGKRYLTPRGEATWDGEKFVQ